MLAKIMGLLDVGCVLILFIHPYVAWKWPLLAAIWLIGKAVIFGAMGSIASVVDGLIGVYIIIVAIGFSWWILTLGAVLWIGSKAFFTLIA